MISAAEVQRHRLVARAVIFVLTIGAIVVIGALVSCGKADARVRHHHAPFDANGNDPRPRAWCGWWMRHELGVADRGGNRARWWAHYGVRAAGPAVGVLVVWPHHVGRIVGQSETGWVVKSGNDGHAVRERERSLRGVIAFRWPGGFAGL